MALFCLFNLATHITRKMMTRRDRRKRAARTATTAMRAVKAYWLPVDAAVGLAVAQSMGMGVGDASAGAIYWKCTQDKSIILYVHYIIIYGHSHWVKTTCNGRQNQYGTLKSLTWHHLSEFSRVQRCVHKYKESSNKSHNSRQLHTLKCIISFPCIFSNGMHSSVNPLFPIVNCVHNCIQHA